MVMVVVALGCGGGGEIDGGWQVHCCVGDYWGWLCVEASFIGLFILFKYVKY